jgi:ferredoxin-NADP reductase
MRAFESLSIFQATLVSREMVADQTMVLRFAKPAHWSYRAGQFVDITVEDQPETGAEGTTRGFSICSAPRENVIAIAIRTRQHDTAVKRALQASPLGTVVRMEGPFGNLQLHHADRPAVLLAGGIGVAPFRSVLVEAVGGGSLPYRVVLIHANRRPKDAAFAYEFLALERADPNLKFVPTMTAMAGSRQLWDGERGHIDAALLGRHLEGPTDPIFYIAGPAGMVQALRSMLSASGVEEDDIRTEGLTTCRASPSERPWRDVPRLRSANRIRMRAPEIRSRLAGR